MNWLGRRWRFETRLTPEQCAERLRGGIDGYFGLFGTKPVIGHVSTRGASLRKRIWYRNSFQSVLSARFLGELGSTAVECRSGMGYFALVFLVVWSGIMLSFGGSILLSALNDPSPNGPGAGVAFFPLTMIVFAAIFVAFGRWLAREEDAFLEQFLRQRLDASSIGAVFD